MNLLHTLVAFIVALGVLILFHELGHYTLARLCGVKVLRFSIGFGPALWLWRSRGPDRTEWVLAAIPLGGFVRMVDEREGDVPAEDLPRAFNRQSVWKRGLIVAAGPLANFLLAILIYYGLFLHGTSEPRPILGSPVAATPAAQAGVRNGDQVRSVNGDPVATWGDLRWAVLERAVSRADVTLEVTDAAGERRRRELDFSRFSVEPDAQDPWAAVGLTLFEPTIAPVIGRVEAGQSADRAGLAPGDRIVSLDGHRLDAWRDFVRSVQTHPGQTLALEVENRKGARRSVALTPSAERRGGETIGRIGAAVQVDEQSLADLYVEQSYGVAGALGRALSKTWEMSAFSLRMMGRMLTGELSWRNLSGPVTIADYAGQSAQQGLIPYVVFIALISISIGVLNLLPIPVLDGGHLLYFLIEVLMGRAPPQRVLEIGQKVGLGVLLALMALAIFNDLTRQLSG